MKSFSSLIWLILLSSLMIVGCSSENSPAAQSVESFLHALTDKEEALMISYTCSDYELDAYLEFDSYALVKTQLKSLSCQEVSLENGEARVSCKGSIEATYGNEQRSFNLTERIYSVIQDGGVWLVCGYTK